MRKNYNTSIALLAVFTFLSSASLAQDFDAVFDIGTEDANTYLQSYSEPSIAAFGNGLTGGWYNTAKPHKLLGFDLTVSGSLVTIPSEEQLFTFRNSDYTNLQISGGSTAETQLPTLTGPETEETLNVVAGATVTNPVTGEEVVLNANAQSFAVPNGIDVGDRVPVPIVQLGIGIVKNTDLKFRFVPAISVEDAEFSLWGVGVQHDIKQWIPGVKSLPIDISVLLATTQLKLGYDLNVGASGDDVFIQDGLTEFKVSASTFQVIVSKKLSVFTPYLGLGYNAVSSSLKVTGDLEYTGTVSSGGTSVSETVVLSDPIDLEFEGAGGPRLTAGFRLKLAVITLHADYTLQKYSMINAGFGINVR